MNEKELNEIETEAELWVRKLERDFDATWNEPEPPPFVLPPNEDSEEG